MGKGGGKSRNWESRKQKPGTMAGWGVWFEFMVLNIR
jgi:hypothetical protein